MLPRTDVLVGSLTHVGMERTENQDYYGYWEPEDDAELERKGRLFVVCDGMGGHAGGQVASRLAVETILERFKAESSDDALETLRGALEAANAAIFGRAQAEPELFNMGSTVVAMIVKGGAAFLVHAGDSRCYLVRKERLEQLTKDHSMVQAMVDEGIIEESEMEDHPRKNVILRCLGVKPEVEVALRAHPLEPDDIYCLSSDGLTGLVSKEDCRLTLLEHRDDPMAAARRLVEQANANGGTDNVTVQVVKIVSLDPRAAPAAAPPRARPKAVPTPEELAGPAPKAAAAEAAPPAEAARPVTMALGAPSREELDKLRAAQPARRPPPPPAPAPRPSERSRWLRRLAAIAAIVLAIVITGLVVGLIVARVAGG